MFIWRKARASRTLGSSLEMRSGNSYLGRICERLTGKLQPSCTGIDDDPRIIVNLAGQQFSSERCLELALDESLQRACPVRRIVAALGQVVACFVGQLELDFGPLEPLTQANKLDVDNLTQLLAGQRMEHDDLVDAI